MTDSPRRDGSEPTQSFDSGYPVNYPDPAYANQPPYQGSYPVVPGPTPQAVPPAGSSVPNPTQQLPSYPPYGYDPNASGQYGAGSPPPGAPTPPEPDNHEPRLWLWILAAVAVLVVLGLVIALVIANGSRQETVLAPQPITPQPGFTTSPTAPTRTSRAPRPIPAPTTAPPTATTPGPTETVTYEVTGEGRAINITYLDTGNMLQTEFNVALPWSKQVELAQPATETASVSVVNFGPEVACTVTVNGVQTQHRTGSGITICVGTS
ncbi:MULTISPECIES: MmpS family transport accessory protein [unclassified Mycolicibacterium]|uniref:MmpS family transport accessory protein n=1 Tax=unclassified Mycolicibacterium TaxID=2636767 RepID=UPI0012DEC91B|nr:MULTISPECIES: MmpS family transport accessory protein [unclassified Mycolicibacterium]